MTSMHKALIFGVLVWLVPFAVAFLIFPLHGSSRPLFESIMPVVISAATVVFAVTYLRQWRPAESAEQMVRRLCPHERRPKAQRSITFQY